MSTLPRIPVPGEPKESYKGPNPEELVKVEADEMLDPGTEYYIRDGKVSGRFVGIRPERGYVAATYGMEIWKRRTALDTSAATT